MSHTSSNRRPWFHGWRGRLLAVITGFSMLAAAELVCILFGWGKVTDSDDPFVGFSEIHPLFVRDIGGENYVVAPSRRKFFPPESFPAHKKPGNFRIFCLGGSTVQGNPFSKETSFTTWLELALKAADPSRDWEVINCGGISYASYRLAPILQECLAYQPDLFILCTGHNEFLEDRTYHEIKHAPKLLAAPHQAVARLRTYTLLREAVNSAVELRAMVGRVTPCAPQFVSDGSDGAHGVTRPTLGLTRAADGWPTPQTQRTPSQFAGKSVMKGEVDPWLDYNGGLKIYHRDPEWQRGVITHFANNLRRMVASARDVGVPVMLVQPPSNLRNCPPFKSEHRAGLTEEQERQWEALMAQAEREFQNDPRQSAELLRQAMAIDDQYAGTFYSLAKCYERTGEIELARNAFRMARELDVCPLRMLEPMERAMAAVAMETGTSRLDAHQLLERESVLGILGDDLLLDHIHPSIHGHQKIAGSLMDMMAQHGWVKPRGGWTARRDDVWQQHLASLGDDYFRAGEVALKGLRAWTQGRASGPPIEYRVLGGGLSAPNRNHSVQLRMNSEEHR